MTVKPKRADEERHQVDAILKSVRKLKRKMSKVVDEAYLTRYEVGQYGRSEGYEYIQRVIGIIHMLPLSFCHVEDKLQEALKKLDDAMSLLDEECTKPVTLGEE